MQYNCESESFTSKERSYDKYEKETRELRRNAKESGVCVYKRELKGP